MGELTTRATAYDLAELVASLRNQLLTYDPATGLAELVDRLCQLLLRAEDCLRRGADAEDRTAAIHAEIAVRRARIEDRDREDIERRLSDLDYR